MSFIYKPVTTSSAAQSAQLEPVMHGVLVYLQQAEARLSALAQAAAGTVDNGDDDDVRVVVSSTDLTDLKMLIAIMDIKFK